ncbi:BTB/POZ protein, partial [Usnea florida]
DRLVANIKSLWTSHMYSDLVVRCGEEEYKVHRAILCPRSAFFAKACNGNFIERKTGIITMDDDDPEAVKRLLLYLYTFDYPDEDDSDVPVTTDRSYTPPLPSATTLEESISDTMSDSCDGATPHDPRMMTNVLVYAVAEKYDIPELKDLAKHKFGTLARSKWPQDGFHAVTEAVFSTTPDTDMGLRQIVMDICSEHFEDILRDKDS